MERFYSDVFGLVVTDRGVGAVFRNDVGFMTGSADQHHQLVLASGRQPDAPSTVMQISFKVSDLADLRDLRDKALAAGASDAIGLNHGNAWSVYFNDPEGNRIEIYLGFSEQAKETFDRYPFGGLCEYMVAPANGCVKLPDNVTCQQATRLGYTGTGYSALRKGGAGPDVVTLINGATGTLGLPTVLCALALGTTKILAVARNKALLEELRQLAPGRIFTHSTDDGPVRPWAIDQTEGDGVDLAVDCVGPGGTAARRHRCST
ncbi:VOC family protein [Novosphingobium sp. PASSN1]|uniref:VOC family protein n=1 Tax=Novosphingobium sp. PASSN1 TaxID=2015561 RepID=UPI0025DB9554|nr:VOC family protein [Novosphingobium sp. PASSN1]